MKTQRYAIYFAPPINSGLWCFGSSWLGRDAFFRVSVQQPLLKGFDKELLQQWTLSPRRYGFHATLKPPFRLKDGKSVDDLVAAMQRFSCRRELIKTAHLILTDMDGFLALKPRYRSIAIENLAADCMQEFDCFRAPSTEEELLRRRSRPLTTRQEKLLQQWGYPYVFEEFRFHMTLTDRLRLQQRKALLKALYPLVFPFCKEPFIIDRLALFYQPAEDEPFILLQWFPLAEKVKRRQVPISQQAFV